MAESLNESKFLELNASKDKVRRLSDKALPGLITKKSKKDENPK